MNIRANTNSIQPCKATLCITVKDCNIGLCKIFDYLNFGVSFAKDN